MDYIFLTGIIGSLVLVLGAAWKDGEEGTKPIKSVKNWLFAIGAVIMLLFASLDYYINAAPVFFVILEILVLIACMLMMTTWSDRLKTIILGIAGGALLIWSLMEFDNPQIAIFVLGLIVVALGYSFEMGSLRRSIALTLGSILIAWYSYLTESWIFFGLNLVFGLFSGYYIADYFKKSKRG